MSKKALAEAYLDLSTEKKLDQITVNDICQEAGLSRRTFYNHFEDKNALTGWIYYQQLGYVFKQNIADQSIESTFVSVFEKIFEYKEFYATAFQDDSVPTLKDYMIPYTEDIYREVIDTSEMTEEERETMIFCVKFYCRGAVGAMEGWVKKDSVVPVETFSKNMLNVLPLDMKNAIERSQNSSTNNLN